MNLLEAFYYTFAADASKLDQGLSDSEKKADQLKDAVSKTDAAADKLGSSFLSLSKAAVGLLGVGLSLGGLKMLAIGTAETTSELGKQARQMNVNVSTLDAWRKAVTESDGDADAFTTTLGNMAQRFRDPEAALLRYSKVLGGMSSFRAQRLGKMIGLDEGTIELLRKGKVSVEELIKKQKEQGVITKQQVEMTDKFNKDLRVLSMSFGNLKTEVGLMLIPVLQYLLNKWNDLSKWVKENKGPLGDVFMVIAGIVTAYYLPAMLRAAAATIAATWPIIAIGAAIALLGLVVADVIGYFRGWDSITGRLAKKFPELDRFLQASKAEVLALWDALVTLFTNPMQYLENLKNEIKGLLDDLLWKGAGDTIFDFMGRAADEVSALWKDLKKLIDNVVNIALAGFRSIENAWKEVKKFFGAGEEEVEKANRIASAPGSDIPQVDPALEQAAMDEYLANKRINDLATRAQSNIAAMNSSPITTMTSNSIANSKQSTVTKKTDVRIDSITVETQATDAQGVADGMYKHISDTFGHFNDGSAA